MNKSFRHRGQHIYVCDPDLPPILNLTAAIIRRAIADAEDLHRGIRPTPYDFPFGYEELEEFFASRWCATLLSLTSLSGDDIRKAANI